MLKAADSLGRDLDEIVAWSGRKPRTRCAALAERLRQSGGIEALADAPRSGRVPWWPRRRVPVRAMQEAVQSSPRELGLGFDVWTSERLGAYLVRTTGVRG